MRTKVARSYSGDLDRSRRQTSLGAFAMRSKAVSRVASDIRVRGQR